MIQIDAPFVLWLAPVVAVAGYFAADWARQVRLRRARAWSPAVAQAARREGRWVPLALATTLGAGTVGLSGPRWGNERVTTETHSLNLVLAVDVSRSMLARDATPNRLGRALREARRLVQDLPQDRIGLLAFAGTSYILAPLTADAGALMLFLDALDPDVASSAGTALAPVLKQGAEVLSAASEAGDRVLVIFTDGEAHDSLAAALEEARTLATLGVRLVLVAEGGREPATIPVLDDAGKVVDVWRDRDGRVVGTARRDDILNAVADAAGGAVVAAELGDQAGAVRDLLAAFKRVATTRTETRRGILRAWIPAALGALVLLLAGWRRPTASLIALAAATGLPGALTAQWAGRDQAHRAWESGAVRQAAELYVREVRAGRGGDTSWLNAGTAALALGDAALADTALQRAARSLDPEVRFRALFNAGWLALGAAARDSARRAEHAGRAEAAYREALRLKPADRDAKWNLELAVRQRRAAGGRGQPQRSGGGGGAPPPPQAAPPPPTEPSGLSQSQAEQILASVAQEELRTRSTRLGRFRASTPAGGKDW